MQTYAYRKDTRLRHDDTDDGDVVAFRYINSKTVLLTWLNVDDTLLVICGHQLDKTITTYAMVDYTR
jgi:hypothetical protein